MALSAGLGGLTDAAGAPRPLADGGASSQAATSAAVHGGNPDVSADGRWVVYAGLPTDESGRTSTIWLVDSATSDARPVELTVPVAGIRAGNSTMPAISGDGCFVAAVTEMAYDFFRDDDEDQRWDVYRLELPFCKDDPTGWQPTQWELVSTASESGGSASALDRATPTQAPAVSHTGAVIAYTQQAREGRNPLLSITVADLTVPLGDANRTTPVRGTPAEQPDTTHTYTGQHEPAVSADGRFVAFTSDARSDLAPPVWGAGPTAGGPAASHVYLWDRDEADPARAVVMVTAAARKPSPQPSDQSSTQPADDDTAAAAAMSSSSTSNPSTSSSAAPTTTVPVAPASDPTGSSAPGSSTPASTPPTAPAATPAEPSDRGGNDADVSADGHYVVFTSASSNLVHGLRMPACVEVCPQQVYRYDRLTGETELISRQMVSEDGAPGAAANLGASQPTVNEDGSQVGFITRATNLFTTESLAGTEPGDGDVVVSLVDLGQLSRVSVFSDGVTPVAGTNAHPVLSATGRVVVFDTLSAHDLVGSDLPGRQVVSLRRQAQVASPDLDVGTVVVGYPGPEWRIGVKNLGPSTFVPAEVVSTNPDFAVTGGTCGLGVPVLPGQYCEVYIILTPSVPGPITGELTISEVGDDPVTVTSKLSGQGGEPLLAPTPAGADFANTVVGEQSPTITFDITNIGFSIGTVSRLRMWGAHPDDFRVESSTCVGRQMIPGGSCTVEVAFAPTAAGYRTATVLVVTDTGQYTGILLDGTGRFEPKVTAATDAVIAGDPIGLGGSGFAPNSEVTVSWADGSGGSMVVETNSSGGFLLLFETRRTDRAGDRQLLVQGDSSAISIPVRVHHRGGRGPGSPSWGG